MYEVTRRLANLQARLPVHLFASGAASPDLYVTPNTFLLGDDKLVELLEVLDHPRAPELRQSARLRRELLPSVRRDFEMMAAYRPTEPVAFDVPITAIRARGDLWSYFHGVEGWARYTTARFELATSEVGDHFHVDKDPTMVSDVVSRALGWAPSDSGDAESSGPLAGESSSRIKLTHRGPLPRFYDKKLLSK